MKIAYIIQILVGFIFTCMFAINIVLNIMHRNITFAFLSLCTTICSFAVAWRGVLDLRDSIKKNKLENKED